MPTITLEQIDLIMERTNVSYNEAKQVLEQCNGDVVEALLHLENTEKVKPSKSSSEKITSFIDKLNATTFTMRKKDRVYVDVPLSIALLAIILSFYVSIFGIILALAFGIKINVTGENEVASKINSVIDDFKKE